MGGGGFLGLGPAPSAPAAPDYRGARGAAPGDRAASALGGADGGRHGVGRG